MLTKPDFLEKKIILVFTQDKEKISFRNDNLLVLDSESKIKLQISCYNLFAVFIVGGISVTSGIIEHSKKFGFSLVFFKTSFRLYASINFTLEGNYILREKQYKTTISNAIAKQIIINKIANQIYTLKKIRDKDLKDGIAKLENSIEKLKISDCEINEIMGIEGTCAKIYFNRIFKEFNWQGRHPRVKNDEINLLLDIAYTVLFNYIEAILNIYGFDVYKGNLHQEFYKRKSLVCDMVEPFRPIVDYKIRKLINLGQIKNYKFQKYNNRYLINPKDAVNFVKLILEELLNYKSCIFDFIQSYYRWFMKNSQIEKFPKATLKNDNS